MPLGSWNSMQQEIVRWKFCPSIWTNRSMNASSKNYNKLCYQRNVTMAKKKTFPSNIASDGLTVSGLHHSRTETSLLQWWLNCYHSQCTVAKWAGQKSRKSLNPQMSKANGWLESVSSGPCLIFDCHHKTKYLASLGTFIWIQHKTCP